MWMFWISDLLLRFHTRVRLRWLGSKIEAEFRTFCPVKFREELDEMSWVNFASSAYSIEFLLHIWRGVSRPSGVLDSNTPDSRYQHFTSQYCFSEVKLFLCNHIFVSTLWQLHRAAPYRQTNMWLHRNNLTSEKQYCDVKCWYRQHFEQFSNLIDKLIACQVISNGKLYRQLLKSTQQTINRAFWLV